jgi:site-specific DNA-methyltransferase (adenine-specific)
MLQNTDETPINYTACCTLADLTHQPTIEAEKIKNAKRGDINFYLCDNIEFMKTKPDKYYDLAIVDPPYGIDADKAQNAAAEQRKKANGKSKAGRGWKEYAKTEWDGGIPTQEYWNELFRVSKNQIVWGGNYMTEFLPPKMGWIIWDKMQRDFSLADGEMAWTSFDRAMRIFSMSRGEALAENNKYGGRFHPTQKPVKLYRWTLLNYAEKGMKILDTHGGSMTNSIACDLEGFYLDICENEEIYFNEGTKHFDMYKRQTKLF